MKIQHLVFVFILFLASSGFSQEITRNADRSPEDISIPEKRPNLLRELGLSSDQMQQLKQFNAGRRPAMAEAQSKLREAIMALNSAIYSDNVNEESVATRIRVFQAAQAEVSRIRFTNELFVRKILNAEQLIKFRELRKQFSGENRGVGGGRRNPDRQRLFRPGGGQRRFPRVYQ